MSDNKLPTINDIVKKTLDTIEKSKSAIFDIAENARREVTHLKEELTDLQQEVKDLIETTDKLEVDLKRSMAHLMLINKNYQNHSQDDMRRAYESADMLRVELAVDREREKQLILRRNDLERRMKDAVGTVMKADQLVVQVGTVFNYLSGDLTQIEAKLDEADDKKMLAVQVIRAHEEERSRIAREIHDGPAQAMSNVVLKAEICEKLSHIDIEKTRSELGNLKEVVRSCLKDIRRIIYDLRPMSLDDLGLKPTLIKYLQSFTDETGISTELVSRGDDEQLRDKNVVLSVFRVIQECLNNIRKHSEASQVMVQLEYVSQGISIRVRDDGKGFDPSILEEKKTSTGSGFGLYGMKERIGLLDGVLKIDSIPGKGTTIKVILPYETGRDSRWT